MMDDATHTGSHLRGRLSRRQWASTVQKGYCREQDRGQSSGGPAGDAGEVEVDSGVYAVAIEIVTESQWAKCSCSRVAGVLRARSGARTQMGTGAGD